MSLVPFSSADITDILNYVADLVGDFLPLIVVFFGIFIGFWIIDRIFRQR